MGFAVTLSRIDALADVPDKRDHLYQPKLMVMRPELLPWKAGEPWWRHGRVRDQGTNPSCVGHALAAVIDHLRAMSILASGAEGDGLKSLEEPWSSWRMLYSTARFHDEWAGEDYPGSSIRGGLKGFFYNGVCGIKDEPPPAANAPDRNGGSEAWAWYMTKDVVEQARTVQLGAYYRIAPRLSDMHGALNEVKVIMVSAAIHDGWRTPTSRDPTIPFEPRVPPDDEQRKLHAFAIVGYDAEGFWVQNSWGPAWGDRGLARWRYEDWAANTYDAWALQLALVPRNGKRLRPSSTTVHSIGTDNAETHFLGRSPSDSAGPSRLDVLGHFIPFDNGRLDHFGPYNVNLKTLRESLDIIAKRTSEQGERRYSGAQFVPDLAKARADDYHYRHVLIYCLGGWPDETIVANTLRDIIPAFTRQGVYPFFVSCETPLFHELELLVHRCVEEVKKQADDPTNVRRAQRDRLIEGRISVPGNRILRELRRSARALFVKDSSDPDDGRNIHTDGRDFLIALFSALARRYRSGSLSYHLVAHGSGAHVVTEMLRNQEEIGQGLGGFPAFATTTLISPLIPRRRAGRPDGSDPDSLLGSIMARGEPIRVRAAAASMQLARLKLILLDEQALSLDRFSDDYGSAWPLLWAKVLGLDRTENRSSLVSGALPLLADITVAREMVAEASRAGLSIEIDKVSSRQDDADSSLHHELGFHPRVLDRILQDVLGAQRSERYFGGTGRRIEFNEDGAA